LLCKAGKKNELHLFYLMESGTVNRACGYSVCELIEIIDVAAGWWESGEDDYPIA